jgi:hypothetical protein
MWVTTMLIVSLTDASTKLGHYQGIRILKKELLIFTQFSVWLY